MHKYYTGTSGKLKVKSVETYEGSVSISFEKTIIKKEELFYKNIFGNLMRFSDKYPIPDIQEAREFLINQVLYVKKKSPERSCYFTEYQELVPYPMTKEKEKKLIKQRRKDKNSI